MPTFYDELFAGTGTVIHSQQFAMPPGRLEIVDGRPVFIRDMEVAVVNRKKIVLSDFLIHIYFLKDYKVQFQPHCRIDNLLDSLINIFDVYVYVWGELVLLTRENFVLLDAMIYDMIPATVEQVTREFAKQGISHDMLYFLDLPKLTQYFYSTDQPCLECHFVAKHCNNMFFKCKYVVVVDDKDIVPAGFIPLHANPLPILISDQDIETQRNLLASGQVIYASLINLLKDDDPTIYQGIPYIECRNLHGFPSWEWSACKSLIIDTFIGSWDSISWEAFNKLKFLCICYSSLTAADVHYILDKCPTIEGLALYGNKIIDSATFVPLPMTSLRKLYVCNCGKKTLFLSIKERSPLLQIYRCPDDPNEGDSIEEQNLRYILELDAAFNVASLCSSSKILDLLGCAAYKFGIFENIQDQLAAKLPQCMQLESLIMPFWDYDVKYFEKIKNPVPSLIYLQISLLKLNYNSMMKILHIFPNLQILEIRHIHNLAVIDPEIIAICKDQNIQLLVNRDHGYTSKDLEYRAASTPAPRVPSQTSAATTKLPAPRVPSQTSAATTKLLTLPINDPNKLQKLEFKKIFFAKNEEDDPTPEYYREKIISAIIPAAKMVINPLKPFTLSELLATDLITIATPKTCSFNLRSARQRLRDKELFGTTTINLTNVWQPLPSINPKRVARAARNLAAKNETNIFRTH